MSGANSSATPSSVYSYVDLAQPAVLASVHPLHGPPAGGAVLVITGSGFNLDAVVSLSDRASGASWVCDWKHTPGMSCNDTVIMCDITFGVTIPACRLFAFTVMGVCVCLVDVVRCVAPPLNSSARAFDVVVSVAGVLSTFTGGQFVYDDPVVLSVSPAVLPSSPTVNASVTVVGINFGSAPGSLSVAARAAACFVWTDSIIVCSAPFGVVASAAVVVITANLQRSAVTVLSTLSYAPPVVRTLSTSNSSTDGGGVLTVTGAGFNYGEPLPVTVWLSRLGVPPRPPWGLNDPTVLLQCVVDSTLPQTSTEVSCTLPSGSGTGWVVVVVNHDLDIDGRTMSTSLWQSSRGAATSLVVNYLPPVITSLEVLSSGSERPATGQFPIRVVGVNFGWPAG